MKEESYHTIGEAIRIIESIHDEIAAFAIVVVPKRGQTVLTEYASVGRRRDLTLEVVRLLNMIGEDHPT